ncbi:MAG: cobalamin-binding protein [Candidatus Omnitrophica bacterium]|nr:cobalamin-binding protein [Candidatus Omnitrophota bacterium]MDD5552737.1 cobalamin-binding protein [Candidatus Omnitrophota bacterium]
MKKLLIFLLGTAPILLGAAPSPRYISLAPAATEILFALGLDKEVVGDSTYCNYPEQAKRVQKIGTFSDPNIEKIVSLKPDIIFTTGLEQAPSVTLLKRLGFRVIVSDPKNIRELYDSIKEIGRAVNKESQADSIVNRISGIILKIGEKVEKIPRAARLNVFIEIWHDPIMTAGPGSFVDELINLAGAKNIAYDVPRPYSRFSAEKIIERDPDAVILCYMQKQDAVRTVSRRLGWHNIKAVKNNRVIAGINPDLILRPGPRIAQGLEEIYNNLYNE